MVFGSGDAGVIAVLAPPPNLPILLTSRHAAGSVVTVGVGGKVNPDTGIANHARTNIAREGQRHSGHRPARRHFLPGGPNRVGIRHHSTGVVGGVVVYPR